MRKIVGLAAIAMIVASAAQAQTLTRQDQNILGASDAVKRSVTIKVGGPGMGDVRLTSGSLHRTGDKHYVCGTMTYRGHPQRFLSAYAHNGPSLAESSAVSPQAFSDLMRRNCSAASRLGDFDWSS